MLNQGGVLAMTGRASGAIEVLNPGIERFNRCRAVTAEAINLRQSFIKMMRLVRLCRFELYPWCGLQYAQTKTPLCHKSRYYFRPLDSTSKGNLNDDSNDQREC